MVQSPSSGFSRSVIRPEDLLVLVFDFLNLKLLSGDGQPDRLVRVDPNAKSFIVVHFPPQNIAEQVFFEIDTKNVNPSDPSQKENAFPVKTPTRQHPFPPDNSNNTSLETPTPPPVEAIISGPSQLAFEIPSTITEIPYRLDALLDWTKYTLRVAPNALPPHPTFQSNDQRPKIVAPNLLDPSLLPVTSIEAPYRLFISPNNLSTWVNATQPIDENRRTELWHTRLAVFNTKTGTYEEQYDAQENPNLTIRAIWSQDSQEPHPTGHSTSPFRMSLDPRDRYEIVRLSSDFTIQVRRFLLPLEANAEGAINLAPTQVPTTNLHPVGELPAPILPIEPLPPIGQMPINPHPIIPPIPNPIPLPPPFPLFTYYDPEAIPVNRLMLSSLGAWMDVRGQWTPPPVPENLSVEEWRHRAAMGRDSYVRVVYQGYLFPFGNGASLIKIGERKFYQDTAGTITAYLFQRMYIVVREPEVFYTPGRYQNLLTGTVAGQGREMPFTSIRITTLVTPDLYDPQKAPSKLVYNEAQFNNIDLSSSFWPMVLTPDGKSATDFKFHIVAIDALQQTSEFTASLIFVSDEDRYSLNNQKSQDAVRALQSVYKDTSYRANRRTCIVPGQKIAFVRSNKALPDGTVLQTQALLFDIKVPAQNNPDAPRFVPCLEQADVRVPAIERLLGTKDPVNIQLYGNYVANDIDAQGQMFASLVQPLALGFPGDKSGGMATPNLGVTGLSQVLGPTGDTPDKLAAGTFDPSNYFDPSAMILGAISLKDIIPAIQPGGLTGGGVPKLTTVQNGQTVTTTLVWTPTVKPDEPLHIFNPADPANTLILTSTITTSLLPGGASTYNIVGVLKSFKIVFASMIEIGFNTLTFTSQKGHKADISADISGVNFINELSFVNALRDHIPSTGFTKGLTIDVTPSGIDASYSLGLPSLAVCIFSLENVALAAGLDLPFTGIPASLSFAFSTREHPFHLIVSLLGGGGFFGIEVGLDGLHMMEAALEFGAEVSIDLGLAAGSVSVMAGIYFKMQKTGTSNSISLTGYVRIDGSVEVLGLITVSVEFYVSLSYESSSGDVVGQATLTVKVEIAFFSQSVSLHVEKRFHGSGGGGGGAVAPHAQPMILPAHAAPIDGGHHPAIAGAGVGNGERASTRGSVTTSRTTTAAILTKPTPVPTYTLPAFGDLETEADWATYCAAFA